jgi:hypothetical protein
MNLVSEKHFFEPSFTLEHFVISAIPFIRVIRGQKESHHRYRPVPAHPFIQKNPRNPW